ncbi:hypothetical protein J26TS2_00040 [Shouchella clausii]|nr:hypothetical protein J26TS2_00040 [Shouchella clausii]
MAEVTFETIAVKRKKKGVFNLLGRVLLGLFGLFGFMLAAILILTIIGIIPGMAIMASSLLFIGIAFLDMQEVRCPHCNKKVGVHKKAEDFECKRCKRTTIIDWE